MGIFTKKPTNYYIKYFPGGGSHGITSTYVDELIEDLTGLPLHKTFNMFAGSSIGSINASALNSPSPASKNEKVAIHNSRSFRYALMRVMMKTLPYKNLFYARQIIIGVPNLLFQGFAEFQKLSASGLDKALNRGLRSLQNSNFWPLERKIKYVKPFTRLHDNILKPVNDFIVKIFEPVVKSTFYDINVLRDEMKEELQSPYTQEVPSLQDTLISHHSIAFNVTRNKPAYFVHLKDPVSDQSLHISDNDLKLHDMCCRSSAAQTIFQHFKDENGELYADSADTDTVKTSATLITRNFQNAYRPVTVTIGTGEKRSGISSKATSVFYTVLGQMLHVRPFASAHIIGKETKDLGLEIGKNNIFEINRSREAEVLSHKYEDLKNNGELRPLLKVFGAEAIRQSFQNEMDNAPDDLFLIDSREKTFRVLNRFGYAMAWEHALEIADLSKNLLENAADYGHISHSQAKRRIQAIDSLFNDKSRQIEILTNTKKHENAANDEIPSITSQSYPKTEYKEFRQEMYEKWPFFEDLKKLFNELGACPEDYKKTPFVPLRFGTALSDPTDKEVATPALRKTRKEKNSVHSALNKPDNKVA